MKKNTIKNQYLKLLIFLIERFKKRYYPECSGEGNYLIEGTIALIEQVIRDEWR